MIEKYFSCCKYDIGQEVEVVKHDYTLLGIVKSITEIEQNEPQSIKTYWVEIEI